MEWTGKEEGPERFSGLTRTSHPDREAYTGLLRMLA
jgi:hypothetical protein